jgi:pre-60S factor REI1
MEDERKFTCISCQVILEDQEKHVAHHKSDFHRFNLKRKMINLPPVTLEQFNSKVAGISF